MDSTKKNWANPRVGKDRHPILGNYHRVWLVAESFRALEYWVSHKMTARAQALEDLYQACRGLRADPLATLRVMERVEELDRLEQTPVPREPSKPLCEMLGEILGIFAMMVPAIVIVGSLTFAILILSGHHPYP